VKWLIGSLVVITGASVFAFHLATLRAAGRSEQTSQAASQIDGTTAMSTGLILAAGEGERLIRRQYGFPLIIKVDPVNGGSKHMVVGTEEIPAGKSIPVHKHSHADEFIVLQEGRASVTLGARRQTAQSTTATAAFWSTRASRRKTSPAPDGRRRSIQKMLRG
jgi:quercetin dioxygenase-like cupin family protein